VVGIDYLDVDPLPGVRMLKKDFLDADAPAMIRDALGGHRADVLLSDMAAPTTGHRATDHLRIVALCEVAADFAREVLAPGGAFLAKVFRGGTEHTLLADLKRDFAKVHHVKPPASRSDSPELYLLATGFRGSSIAAPLDHSPRPEAMRFRAGSRPLSTFWPTWKCGTAR
jgi:23S rRNA (uridine2552-2'-O)-methyltransferase